MRGGLVCRFDTCHKPILGPESGKRIEVHRVDGALVVFGRGMPAGPVELADGQLVDVYHGVCYWRLIKRMRLAAQAADPSGNPAELAGLPAMWRVCPVDSVEVLEELERLQNEFGRGKCQLPDPLQGWWHDIERVEFDPGTQTYRFVPDS